mmetsp:Transcript_26543/g.68525  ORF Transcript_26543/g.68525 Transcript_26543/m.68525 type:complete len:341 (+) Transcript_26543:632-1654(+)
MPPHGARTPRDDEDPADDEQCEGQCTVRLRALDLADLGAVPARVAHALPAVHRHEDLFFAFAVDRPLGSVHEPAVQHGDDRDEGAPARECEPGRAHNGDLPLGARAIPHRELREHEARDAHDGAHRVCLRREEAVHDHDERLAEGDGEDVDTRPEHLLAPILIRVLGSRRGGRDRARRDRARAEQIVVVRRWRLQLDLHRGWVVRGRKREQDHEGDHGAHEHALVGLRVAPDRVVARAEDRAVRRCADLVPAEVIDPEHWLLAFGLPGHAVDRAEDGREDGHEGDRDDEPTNALCDPRHVRAPRHNDLPHDSEQGSGCKDDAKYGRGVEIGMRVVHGQLE